MRVQKRGHANNISSKVFFGLVSLGCGLLVTSQTVMADWEEVQEDVREQIAMLQPPIGPHSIVIDHGEKGKVTLEGYVESMETRRRVEEAAAKAKGVTSVDNQLSVSAWIPPERSEEVSRIQEAIHKEGPKGRYNVRVISQPDRVILRGTVDNSITRARIVEIASSVSRKQVSDELVEKVATSDSDIEAEIRRVVAKDYPALVKKLEVSSHNGLVTLKGSMASRRQIDAVLAAILNIEGVQNVESNLTIQGRQYTGSKETSR